MRPCFPNGTDLFRELLSAPVLIAGTVAVALFVTSNRRAQTTMGIRGWRLLQRLTRVVPIVLSGHVVLVGDIGPGAATLGFIGRIPAVGNLSAASALVGDP